VTDTDQPTPALYDHAVRVYKEMRSRATKQEVEGQTVDVYEGHLTNLFRDLDIANPYYTKIRKALVGQNCIAQLRRGGGTALSKWIILNEPEEDTFRAIMDRKTAPKGASAELLQSMRGLKDTVNGLYSMVDVLQTRVEKYEADLSLLRDYVHKVDSSTRRPA
jgi:hypothetical protein